ncbi:Ger(x)C family spore germination protein [Brevibacillus fulvus]|uniref:Spore germination protein KC n=1 Tax=Brevibacillus fulvus TaxID=1125967 RepID=A0A939BN69_9BACL|nr:Ger(x)C family spore germination protein [Brevibacillus fulvus]MBM7588495.1 spore germination protein KC [Brevibacillus fulvus]
MKRKVMILLLLTSLFLTGCWDRRELNEISMVSGMAVEQGEKKKYRMTVEVINPTAELNPAKGTSTTPAITYSMEGDALSQLRNKMDVGMSRRMVYSHMRIVYIDEKIARKGFLEFLDFLERDREIRDDFYMIVASGVPAKDALAITYPIQKAPSLKVHAQLQALARDWGGSPDVREADVINALTTEGIEPVAIAVGVQGDAEQGMSMDNEKSVEPNALLVVKGMGVFKKEKLLGYVSVTDTRNFMWIRNKLRFTSLLVPYKNNKFFSVRIFRSGTRINVDYQQGRPVISIKIKAEGRIDTAQFNSKLDDPKSYRELERQTKAEIEKQIKTTIHTVQKKFASDIFGFGLILYRQNPEQFAQVKKIGMTNLPEREYRWMCW